MTDDVAPGQDGMGNWWNDIRREDPSNYNELAMVKASIKKCPHCDGGPWLWSDYPYWHIDHEEDCTMPDGLHYDEPQDAVDAWNEMISNEASQ